jgi:Bacterial regulatory proteins, luxR family
MLASSRGLWSGPSSQRWPPQATNREIAQQLFVTPATEETHLTRVYRKLVLDGRTGLAGALVAAAS